MYYSECDLLGIGVYFSLAKNQDTSDVHYDVNSSISEWYLKFSRFTIRCQMSEHFKSITKYSHITIDQTRIEMEFIHIKVGI